MMLFKRERGFTLLEVIIAIAILGIIILSFLGMFINGHRWVFDAGKRADDLFTNQSELESELASGGTVNADTIGITFDGESEVTVNGDIISGSIVSESGFEIDAFRPKY